MTPITSSTRLVALLGDPVAHSLSPRLQNAAFAESGVDGVYVAIRCDAATFPGLMTGIARAGGAGNVTIPHKALAAGLIEAPTEAVLRTGACNTFWLEDGRIHGDNTDVAGFRAAVRALVGSVRGARVLLLGAGGAAAAAVAGLLEDGADSISIQARSPERALSLVARFDAGDGLRVVSDPGKAGRERFDVVVNATPLGLHAGDPLPFDFECGPAVGAALDLVYAPGETAWVHEARRRGILAADGREMLLAQGAAAFERWWGRPAPVEAMRRALDEVAVAAR